jgi:hypothetical protein
LKVSREKQQVTYKGKPSKITYFSKDTLKQRKVWNDVFQALNKNNCQPRLLYLTKLSFIIEGKMKSFHDKQKLREFMTTKQALQRILKGILHTEEEDKPN